MGRGAATVSVKRECTRTRLQVLKIRKSDGRIFKAVGSHVRDRGFQPFLYG